MCGSEYGIGYSAADSSVNEDYFKICSILGQGRCVLYEESTYKYALKMVDASKHKDLAEEVRSEASIYKKLEALQGIYIPKLIWEGSYYGILEGIALQPIGSTPSSLTNEQQQKYLIEVASNSRRRCHTQ